MHVAIPLYPEYTALDAVGPYAVLAFAPGWTVTFVAAEPGPVLDDRGNLSIVATASYAELPRPEVTLVPGGPGTYSAASDTGLLNWISQAHEHTRWTTSVCSGSFLLGAAGLGLLTYAVVQTGTHPWHSARLILMTRITPSGTLLGSVILPTMIFGAGLAPYYIPMTVAAVYHVPPERTGVASALVNVTRTVGGAVGLAVISTIVTSRTSHEMAAGYPAGDALSSGFRLAFVITAALLAAAAVFALAIFRAEGRGEKLNLAEVTRAGIES